MASTNANLVSYLRGMAIESAQLSRSDPRFPDGNPVQFCFDHLLAHLIVRAEAAASLVAKYDEQVRGPATTLRHILVTHGDHHQDAIPRPPHWWGAGGGAPPDPEARFAAVAGYVERLVATAGTPDAAANLGEVTEPLGALAAAEVHYQASITEAEQLALAGFGSAQIATDALTVDQVAACFTAVLPDWKQVLVAELAPVPGLHSREVYIGRLDDGAQRSLPIVIRRDRTANLVPGSVADEYPIMTALHDRGLPVPEPICFSVRDTPLGRPYIAMTKVEGAIPTPQTLSELGDIAAKQLVSEIAVILARLHDTPIAATGLGAGDNTAREVWNDLLTEHEEWWKRVRSVPSPGMEWARLWLRQHIDVLTGELRIVHGDFHLRNFLVAEGHVTGLLDFELTKLGHPAEDLGAIRPEIEAAMDWDEFLAHYRDAGGVSVTPEELAFCDVWAAYRYRIITGTANHLYATGQTDEIFFTLADQLESPQMFAALVAALNRAQR